MSRWSTGAVGPSHRAVMRDGIVLAVAESTDVASEIVRRMNEPERRDHWLKERVRELADGIPGHAAEEIRELIDQEGRIHGGPQ